MAKISLSDADKYGKSGFAFFQLKNDGDVETVRILYETAKDIDAYVVHRVESGKQRKYVSCLCEHPDDPVEKCPLCSAGYNQTVRLFIPLYVEKDNNICFWERGKNIAKQLISLASRYNPLCGTSIEIERNGKSGDNQTTYQFYPLDSNKDEEPKYLDDFPPVPDVIGTYVLDLSSEEMKAFLSTGELPNINEMEEEQEELPVRRRSRDEMSNSSRRDRGSSRSESTGRSVSRRRNSF